MRRPDRRMFIGMKTTTSAIIGQPGGGLTDGNGGAASWAANAGVAKAGQDGEVRTARILNPLSSDGGATILHDLNMPVAGIKANIDHIVVSGSTITILDSKTWKPGFFWTMGGKTRRGGKSFPYGDKKTMTMAAQSIERYLNAEGVTGFNIAESVVIVWPTNDRNKLSLWAMRFPGAKLISGAKFTRRAKRICGNKAADAAIVDSLRKLVISVQNQDRGRKVNAARRTQAAQLAPAPQVTYQRTGTDPYASDSYSPAGGATAPAPASSPPPLPANSLPPLPTGIPSSDPLFAPDLPVAPPTFDPNDPFADL